MRPTHLLVPLLGAGLVAAGVVAVGAGGQDSTPPTGTLTLTVTTKDKDGSFVDQPPRKRQGTNGDTFYGRGTVTGDAKGTAAYSVTLMGGKELLHAIIDLPGGDLFVEEQAIESSTKSAHGAILGGTGAYPGARGSFVDKPIKDTKEETVSTLTVSFL